MPKNVVFLKKTISNSSKFVENGNMLNFVLIFLTLKML